MPKVTSVNLDAGNHTFAIVVARFNSFITSKLLDGALEAIARNGGNADSTHVVHVPGALEIPLVAKTLVSQSYDAVICLGAVIRGETAHFDFVCAESARGVNDVALQSGKPVINGILTTNNVSQAIERAGVKSGNKGWDAGMAAIEMANVMKELKG